MFTADPSTGDRDRIVIEAAFGLGEVVVGGQVEPDTYVLSKDGPRLAVEVRVGHKTHKLVSGPTGSIVRVELDEARGGRTRARPTTRSSSSAALGHAGRGALRRDRRTSSGRSPAVRPSSCSPGRSRRSTDASGRRRATARRTRPSCCAAWPRRPGIASGRVRVLRRPARARTLAAGRGARRADDEPDWVPTIRRAAALVTDGGGMTCHAAIVSPRARRAVRRRHPHAPPRRCTTASWSPSTAPRARCTRARLGASAGGPRPPSQLDRPHRRSSPTSRWRRASTSTWPSPTRPRRWPRCPVDGVGLLRAEFMLTDALGGVHPRALLASGGRDEFLDRMSESLLRITRAFAPRPVVYRTIDFRTNEFRGLDGGDAVRAGRGQPDDRLPRLLPLHPRARPVRARARAARPGARGDAEPPPDDPVRAHHGGSSRRASRRSTPARSAASAGCTAG